MFVCFFFKLITLLELKLSEHMELVLFNGGYLEFRTVSSELQLLNIH